MDKKRTLKREAERQKERLDENLRESELKMIQGKMSAAQFKTIQRDVSRRKKEIDRGGQA